MKNWDITFFSVIKCRQLSWALLIYTLYNVSFPRHVSGAAATTVSSDQLIVPLDQLSLGVKQLRADSIFTSCHKLIGFRREQRCAAAQVKWMSSHHPLLAAVDYLIRSSSRFRPTSDLARPCPPGCWQADVTTASEIYYPYPPSWLPLVYAQCHGWPSHYLVFVEIKFWSILKDTLIQMIITKARGEITFLNRYYFI